jgi:hypothetical protein
MYLGIDRSIAVKRRKKSFEQRMHFGLAWREAASTF